MDKISEALEGIGLSGSEITTYLALLRLGSATPSELKIKTKLHRISLYDILERLIEKGLVSYSMIGKRKTYGAVDPKKLIGLIEEKKRLLEEAMPKLNAQQAIASAPQEATVFKDKTGIKNIFIEMTKSKTPIYLFASGWGFEKTFPYYYDVWHQRLKENGKVLQTLISKKFVGKKLPDVYKIKYLPIEFIFPSTTAIYDDKVFIIIWGEYPIGIVIQGKKVSDSYKHYFELLWKQAKK